MTRMLLSFLPIDTGIGGLPLNWWDEINESVKWQDGLYFTLCAACGLVSLVAVVLTLLLLDLPGLLFFSTYTLLVLFWAEIYHQAKSLPTDKLRIWYFSINGGIYFIQVGSVTAICFICFLKRCFVVALSAFDSNASLDVLDHPVLNLIYYTLVEILPSALVLYILRKLPQKTSISPVPPDPLVGQALLVELLFSWFPRF